MANLDNNTSLKVALTEIEKKVLQSETDRNSLETILPTKGVTVVPGSKMSTLIGKVKNISVSSLGGKKWASGTTLSSTEKLTSEYLDAGNSYSTSAFYIEYRGLDFKPSAIVATNKVKMTGILTSLVLKTGDDKNAFVYNNGISKPSSSISQRSMALKESANFLLMENGFRIPVYTENQEFVWIAFE